MPSALQTITGCQALNNSGIQCKNKITNYVQFHGDGEIYQYHFDHEEFDCKWVKIGVCKKHYKENFKE